MNHDIRLFTADAGHRFGIGVIDRLTAFELPVTPAHYQVIFAYETGAPPDLVKDIDDELRSGQKITHAMSEALHEKYFANAQLTAQVLETGESIARELEQVVGVLRAAGAHTRDYGQTLLSVTTADTSRLDPVGFRQLVARLVSATADMAKENQKLSAQMEQSTRQVASLKTALQHVKVEALTDRLTGLANRRLFDDTLDAKLAEAEADAAPLSLLMCDIDHFKRFNDTWGHQVGDQVIRYIASVLRAHASGDALAARYGGEEFSVILPRASLERAQACASAIQSAVNSKHLSRRSTGESIGAVTISIGLAAWRRGESASHLIERADQCLYASKRAGRNRITTDTEHATAA
ncbi:MAG: GGDEF domain-containing protein [Terricaulis sp.]